jgi:ABC-2 type transport system permease protein
MAVYRRSYTAYDGPLTPAWSRFLILPRTSYARLWQSRFLVMFFVACYFYPLGLAAYIYLAHNLALFESLGVPAARIFTVEPAVFLYYCWVQGALAYILTAFVGPNLVSPDLSNNALPLYLCRPFTRAEYVLGKMSVLMILLARITWIPGLILFTIQASLEGWDWTRQNLWLAWAIFAGLFVWSLVLSLIALAMSAWVKWRIAAGALILAVFFVGAGLGSAINAINRTDYGSYINLPEVMFTIWGGLFRIADFDTGITAGASWVTLGVVCGLCLWLLTRKVRAFEVVK